MKKRIPAILLALVMLTSAASCGAAPAESGADEPAVVFTDDCGREVEIPAAVTRIVPSGPMAQIVLFSIAPEMLAGLATEWREEAAGIIPEEYYDLPYFGEIYGGENLNVEELALAAPQIIVDIGEPKGNVAEELDALEEKTGIACVHIDAALETMPETYRRLGELLGKTEEAEALADFCRRVYDRTADIMAQVGDNKVNALYCLGEDGLNVIAAGSYHAEMLDMLINNLAVVEEPSSKGTGNAVDMEQILVWNPDFILFAPNSAYDRAAEDATWGEVSAISGGQYVEVPFGPHNWMGTPPSVQRYLGMIWLTGVLYPDWCDYDVKADILEYYRLFYHCELTDEQYGALTENAFPAGY